MSEEGKKPSLSNLGVLAQLHTKRWNAVKTDKRIAEALSKSNRVNKKLLDTRKHCVANTGSYKRIHKVISKLSNDYRGLTAPYDEQGRRFLPNTNITRLSKLVRDTEDELEGLFEEFDKELPDMVEAAEKELGRFFDWGDYPVLSLHTMRAEYTPSEDLFSVNLSLQPITNTDALCGALEQIEGVHQKEVARLVEQERKHRATAQVRIANAICERFIEMNERLYRAVRLYDAYYPGQKPFRDSTVNKFKDFLEVLPGFNVTQDKHLAEAGEIMRKALEGVEAKDLRGAEQQGYTLRETIAKESHRAGILLGDARNTS